MTDVLLPWSAEFSVGLAEVDQQHQQLLDMLNRLHDAIKHHHGSDASRAVLDDLARYTREHFAAEEALMQHYAYPHYAAHKAIHEALLAQVVEFQHTLDAGNAKITYELLHFLKVWLTEHIKGSDKEFGAFALATPRTPQLAVAAGAMAGRPTHAWWQFWHH